MARIQRSVALGCVVMLIALHAVAQDKPPSGRSGAYEAVRRQVERSGVKVGQSVPELKVFTLEGKPAKLSAAWTARPALVVAASITCPIAQNSCPSIVLRERELGPKVHPVILYTVEAHPRDGRSPYAPFTGRKSGFPHDQPDTLEQRLELARSFAKRVPGVEVLVDAMDNAAWKALGGGPNMALLIGTHGKVLVKQAWFDPTAMAKEIEKLPDPPAASSSAGETCRDSGPVRHSWLSAAHSAVLLQAADLSR